MPHGGDGRFRGGLVIRPRCFVDHQRRHPCPDGVELSARAGEAGLDLRPGLRGLAKSRLDDPLAEAPRANRDARDARRLEVPLDLVGVVDEQGDRRRPLGRRGDEHVKPVAHREGGLPVQAAQGLLVTLVLRAVPVTSGAQPLGRSCETARRHAAPGRPRRSRARLVGVFADARRTTRREGAADRCASRPPSRSRSSDAPRAGHPSPNARSGMTSPPRYSAVAASRHAARSQARATGCMSGAASAANPRDPAPTRTTFPTGHG